MKIATENPFILTLATQYLRTLAPQKNGRSQQLPKIIRKKRTFGN